MSTTRERFYLQQSTTRQFTVAEYHKLIEIGVIKEGEPTELLEGYLVQKLPRDTAHDSAMDRIKGLFPTPLPSNWFVQCQRAVTLSDSEPEPDYAVVRGPRGHFRDSHPIPADIGLIVEVSASSLYIDRYDKGRIYARDNVPVYWVVNVTDKVIEVYTKPSGTGDAKRPTRKRDRLPHRHRRAGRPRRQDRRLDHGCGGDGLIEPVLRGDGDHRQPQQGASAG